MALPTTPRHKRLAVIDEYGMRASSTPPAARPKDHYLPIPILSPGSRHSSPGGDRVWNGRHYPDELIPRRLTVSPVASTKAKDRTRKRLPQYHSIDHAVDILQKAKNIVVLTGAGISTSLDIPDFRSDNGFYNRLSASIGLSTPEEFFSLDFFKKEHESFWTNVRPLLPRHVRSKDGVLESVAPNRPTEGSIPRFSKTHAFLALLQASGKLLTNYTQNIDDLEFASGVRQEKIVKCHGSWDTATCLTCGKKIPARKYLPIVWESGFPRCSCGSKDIAKTKKPKPKPKKRKRAVYEGDSDHSSDDGTATPKGLIKPDITFFGEALSNEYESRLEVDTDKADLLLVIGTSLKTRPVKTMVFEFPPDVPQIWINKDRFSGYKCDLPGVQFDIELLGECDLVIQELCRRATLPLKDFCWTPKLKVLQPADRNHAQLPIIPRADGFKPVSEVENKPLEDLVIRNRSEGTPNASISERAKTERKVDLLMRSSAIKTTSESDIRVQSDLDAEWRWRFSKPTASPMKNR